MRAVSVSLALSVCQKQNQQALDKSGDGTLREGGGKRARKSQPWKQKQQQQESEAPDGAAAADIAMVDPAAAPALVHKSREEIITKTLAEKIRKRDEVRV